MATSNTLQASHLTCVRQQRCLFKNLSFDLSAGDLLVVEGANGSGKSSLLRLIAGLSSPISGEVLWCKKAITTIREEYNHSLHYLGHTNGIKWGLTVEENIRLIQQRLLQPELSSIDDVLAELQLDHCKKMLAGELSAGQKRRIALAKLFFFLKSLWIVDEPFTSLDVNTQDLFVKKLQQHLQQGGIAVMSTHHKLPTADFSVKTLRLSAC